MLCRSGRTRLVAAEIRKRIVLSNQPRKFGQRIAGGTVSGARDRPVRWIVGRIISGVIVVPHMRFHNSRVLWTDAASRLRLTDHLKRSPVHLISSGAPTPRMDNPLPNTVTTPWTNASLAKVTSRLSFIMKRKLGKSLPRVHWA